MKCNASNCPHFFLSTIVVYFLYVDNLSMVSFVYYFNRLQITTIIRQSLALLRLLQFPPSSSLLSFIFVGPLCASAISFAIKYSY